FGLAPLPLGVGAPGDAGPGAEAEHGGAVGGPLDPEGADADGQLGGAAVGVDPADAAAVRSAGGGFQRVDDPQGARLGGAGDGAGREGRGEQLGPAGPGAQAAADGGHQVHESRVLLDGAQVGHGAGGADPADVVADEVHDHDVLGIVLLQQVGLGAAGALDRAGLDGAPVAAEEELR